MTLSATVLHSVFDALPIGIAICDEQGMFLDVNPAYATIFSNIPEEMIGKEFTIIFAENLWEANRELYKIRFATGTHNFAEYTMVDKNGIPRTVLADGYFITDEQGRRQRVIFVIDITDRVRVEQEKLIQARQDALIEKLERAVKLTKPIIIPNPLKALMTFVLSGARV